MNNKQTKIMAIMRNSRCLLLRLVGVVSIVSISACSVSEGDGQIVNSVELPLDAEIVLQCPDMGINTETCILDDPNNPYARTVVTNDNKFDLAADTPSAKASFYLWGTALALSAQGENQYFTALALHEMFTQSGDQVAREQAKRAYRATLDFFFDSFTFLLIPTPSGGSLIPLVLSDEVGVRLIEPQTLLPTSSLSPLYDSELEAREALGEWGYAYNAQTGSVTKSR